MWGLPQRQQGPQRALRCQLLALGRQGRFEGLEAVQFIAFKGAAQAIGPVTIERAVLGGIDFKNGDALDFFKHLAKAMAL